MAHPTRGKTSHTYDITEVLGVDGEQLVIRYRDAAHADDQKVQLNVPNTPAARQMLWGMADSISVHGTGMWESAYSLRSVTGSLARAILLLEEAGVDDFRDPAVDLTLLRSVIDHFDTSLKSTINKLFCRLLRRYHPTGADLARALSNTSYMVKETTTELYDDDVADAIHSAARGVFAEAFKAQRSLLGELGYDISDRSWLRIPADQILDDAKAKSPDLVGAQRPRMSSPRLDQIRWALLNPQEFARRGRPPTSNTAMDRIGRAFYPQASVLTAALILQCMAELSGLNLSVMLRTEPDDLVYTGRANGVLCLAKARNHSEDHYAVRVTNNSSLGGLVEALSGLTRFARRWRATRLVDDDGRVPEVVNRLYVEHRGDPRRCEILTTQRMHNGWRSPEFDAHWRNSTLERDKLGLRFGALRRKALERAISTNPKADVHGHSARTRVHYLANVLPEHVLAEVATGVQGAILDSALAKFARVDSIADGAWADLADASRNGQTADLVLSVCATGGNDPDAPTTPCSLGLAACFTCPNGYRTVDHIPGLVATVRFTELIRANDPDEWEHGEASLLHHFATESLKQFPPTVVDGAAASDLTDQLATVGALYVEFRR